MKRILRSLRKWVILLVIIIGIGYVLFKGLQFRLQRDLLPQGVSVAEIAADGLTREEARARVEEDYYRPLYLYHIQDHIQLNPQDVGFDIDLDAMFNELDRQLEETSGWLFFLSFVLNRPLQKIEIPLKAVHDSQGLATMVERVAEMLDKPARSPQMLGTEGKVDEGSEGFITDTDKSRQMIENALYRLDGRDIELVIVRQPAPERSMEVLAEAIQGKLQSFQGLGSIFIMDLATGEELAINADVALSGLSILKIAIFVEAYRAIDGPLNDYQQQLFIDTATRSSNFAANLLLHEVAGEDNTYRGADILTESMKVLGLENTFMAVPYDASPPAHRITTYVTHANSRSDLATDPDPTMQSTAEEIGTLLSMIYYCAKGGGPLIALYPDEITLDECQSIIDLMVLNEEGNLIRFGAPPGTTVSHKHGWANATHADAGIVFSLGGDFVIVEYLNQPGDWLLAEESFPILREIARAAYNYFNIDEPYLSDEFANRGLIDPENPFSEFQETQESDLEEGDSINPENSPVPTVVPTDEGS